MDREALDELRGRWDSRMRFVRHLRDKYELDKTDANWAEYQEMLLERDQAWEVYSAAMATHSSDCEFQPRSAETEQIDCTCAASPPVAGTPAKEK